MDSIRFSITRPVTVLVGVILVLMFGLIGLANMPYQLAPSVEEPEITVSTVWTGASPYEIERDIIEEQEKVLKGISGLTEMESQSYDGFGSITLRFEIGTDVDDATLRVSNKLNEVPDYPENADRPVIQATGADTSPVIWLVLKSDDPHRPAAHARTFYENEVRQYLERVPGVAELFVAGGTESEVHVVVDPVRLASYGLTISQIADILRRENVNISGGNLGLGRRDYRIRTVGEFRSPEQIEEIELVSDGRRRILLRDVGYAEFGFETPRTAIMHNFEPGIVSGVKPEPGANILTLTDAVEEVVRELNETILADNNLRLDWTYDQRPYIRGAIDLVKENIALGAVLASIVLLLFLRRLTATLIVAAAIPISVIGSFIFLRAFGRNLNVVSMAGISFAVGMLVDNAIVVLENIDRHRSMGKSAAQAAYDGTKEVWGAVLASTLTTVAVFLPVVFIREEAGQLFKDIAIAVTCAITLSLFVSVSVIPMLAARLFALGGGAENRLGERIFAPVVRLGGLCVEGIMAGVRLVLSSLASRIAAIVGLTGLAVLITWAFFPKMEYLPQGNRNLIINILITPPGLSYSEREEMGETIFNALRPNFQQEANGAPGISNMFYVSADRFQVMGAISQQEDRAAELIPLISPVINSLPGVFGVSVQASIFESGIGQGRVISVDISGKDLEKMVAAAGILFGRIREAIPGAQIRPLPALDLLYPEIVFMPDRDRLRAAGLSAEELGFAVDVLMDGRVISDFKPLGEKTIDLVLKSTQTTAETPERLYSAMVATPAGRAVPLSSLAELQREFGINQIRHIEQKRTVTLEVTPPREMPLQQAMEMLEQEIIPQAETQGVLSDLNVDLSGAADKLTVTRQALQDNFLLALAITYLLMSALFGNFIYPLIIMFTVPLAAAGGFLALRLQNAISGTPQPLDIVTMLGFIILVGVVVNNAILIVYQALNNLREQGMSVREAILDSTRTRLRPIYMSAATSIFGMLPLAVAPGPGSELYRGLGAVVLGGLALSTVFTVFLIPAMLTFFLKLESPKENAA